MKPIKGTELFHAELALAVAIGLQATLNRKLVIGPQFIIAGLELVLLVGLIFVAPRRHLSKGRLNRSLALGLIGLISLANITSLILVAIALIQGSSLQGKDLITAAIAIFFTNIIVFGLWYWEIDSPGLTGYRNPDPLEHFQFPQYVSDKPADKQWRPTFFDYQYVSLTNATAFSPTDTLPLTHHTKLLMGVQALASLLTLALVAARAVNILH
jgi:hypothetical protein